MPTLEYELFAVCKAYQKISLNPDEETIEYGDITDILDNLTVLIFDKAHHRLVAELELMGTDEEMYETILDDIDLYEIKHGWKE